MKGQEKKVCKLVKSLYGLKQAPKQWHTKFESVIISNGFKTNESDKCVYTRFINGKGVIVCLYVDDMLIFGTDINVINDVKEMLSSAFEMKDMGLADVILGMKITRKESTFVLSQSHYIKHLLEKYNEMAGKPVQTPFDSSIKLERNKGRAVAQLKYASVIGSLMYAMHCTRPDIAYAVGQLSRYTNCPSDKHWNAISRVFGYLRKTIDYGLHYSGYPSVLEGYCDASWNSDSEESLSTSGWVFTLGGAAISWKSKKQTCLAHSTMESEFIALADGGKEAEWLRNFLLEIPLWPKPMPPVVINCDSEATRSVAHNKVYNGRSRHISLRHNYIRELLNGVIGINYVRTSENLADPFTKGLPRDLIRKLSFGIGVKPCN